MLEPGEIVDQFQVTRLVGQGGMGEVYLARDTTLGRKVALKVIPRDRIGSEYAVNRFLQESRTTARFNHPHIITVYGAGEHRGCPYLALEYLEGQTLKQRMREERASLTESMRLGLAIAEALVEAHRHDVLHRDLKPENVLLPKDGRLRVVDFGLAMTTRNLDESGAPSFDHSSEPGSKPATSKPATSKPVRSKPVRGNIEDTIPNDPDLATQHNSTPASENTEDQSAYSEPGIDLVSGTPAYIAPEQWLKQDATAASDIWAFGLVMYQLLAGRHPYRERQIIPLSLAVAGPDPVPSITEHTDLPTQLAELIDNCLIKEPTLRPGAREVVETLKTILEQRRRGISETHSPFRGLFPFAERHTNLFFGRDAEIATFLERIREEPVLPVVGPSGAGKSSLIQAGIIPRLREQGAWTVLKMRPGNQPFLTLATRLLSGDNKSRDTNSPDHTIDMRSAIRDRSQQITLEDAGKSDDRLLAQQLQKNPQLLAFMLQRLAEDNGGKVLLFVDQLEEIYTLVEDNRVREVFMLAICSAADDPQGPTRVIFTVRDDFLVRLAFGFKVREVLSRVTVVRSPGSDALREILTQPLSAVDYDFDDPTLVEEMVEAVEGEPACLPLLQFASQTLWQHRDKSNRLLRRAAYDSMGGVGGALADHADSVLDGLSPSQLQLVREILLRLVTTEGTRRVLPKTQVLDGLPIEAADVLRRLTDARLLAANKNRRSGLGDITVELVHESLINEWDRLARWIDESREEIGFVVEVSQAAELWQRRGCRADEVWRSKALRDALRTYQRCQASVPELGKRFLEAGQRLEARGAMRRRAAVVLLAAIALAAVLLATAFAQQKNTARRQSHQLALKTAQTQRESARAAMMRGDLLEARAKLRGSLEAQDSAFGRALWWKLSQDPLIWKKDLETAVYDVAFAPDGDKIAAACQDKTIYLFDVHTKAVQVLRGHKDQVSALSFSADGRYLAAGIWTGAIRIWDLEHNSSQVLQGHKAAVWHLVFRPDGKKLASASWDKSVRIWDLQAHKQERKLDGHTDYVWGAAYSPDGKLLATSGSDKTIRIWHLDRKAKRRVTVLAGHKGIVSAVAFANDGKLLVSGSYDNTLRVWNVADGSSKKIIKGHSDAVRDIALNPQGTSIASGSSDRTIRLWDLQSGDEIKVLRGHSDRITGLRFSPDGKRLVSAAYDKSIRLWDLGTEQIDNTNHGHSAGVYTVAFSPDGRFLASGSYDQNIVIWEVATGAQKRLLTGHTGGIFDLAYSPDGRRLASTSYDKTVRIWDPKAATALHTLKGHQALVYGVAFSPDGKHVASSSYDKTIRIWDIEAEKALRVLQGHAGWVTGIAYSHDGSMLASTGFDSTVRVWNPQTGKQVKLFKGHKSEVYGVAFSPDGAKLASAGFDKKIRLWDLQTGEGEVIGRHQEKIYSIDFAGDGRTIGTSSADGTARITTLEDQTYVSLQGHRTEVNGFAFNWDASRAATAGDDATVRLWQTEDARPLWKGPLLLQQPPTLVSHRGFVALDKELPEISTTTSWSKVVKQRVRKAFQSPDMKHLCLFTEDSAVELWDIEQDRRLFYHKVPKLQQVVAFDQGCASRSARDIQVFQSDGKVVKLPMEAKTITWDDSELLVAAGTKVFIFDADGKPKATIDADIDVTEVLRTEDWYILGFAEGNIELLPRSGQQKPAYSFETVPSSPVIKMLQGPMDTLIVGYENGVLGMWNLDNGSLLHRTRLHGPVSSLLLYKNTLFAATDLGDDLSLDLGVLKLPYCQLMQSIWNTVPVVWGTGFPVLAKQPEHLCQ